MRWPPSGLAITTPAPGPGTVLDTSDLLKTIFVMSIGADQLVAASSSARITSRLCELRANTTSARPPTATGQGLWMVGPQP